MQRVSEHDSLRDADAIAIHRMKVRRRLESPVPHQERTVVSATSLHSQERRENNVPAVVRSLIAKRSYRDRETRGSETRPIWVHTAIHRQSGFRRLIALPSVVRAISRRNPDWRWM